MRRESAKETLLLCLSFEIWVHLLVFAAVVTPLIAIALPVVLVSFATFEVFQSVGTFWSGANSVSVEFSRLILFSAVLLLARFVSGCRESVNVDKKTEAELTDRLRQPKGVAGQMLRDTIIRIWCLTPRQAKPAPSVAWYSGFQVTAHARFTDETDRIYVSSALWDRVTKQDITAELILAHEMGHVVHHDWRTFRRLSLALHGIRSILGFSKVFAICATVVVVCLTGVAATNQGETMSTVARLEFATIAIATLCFLLLTLSDLFLRRYASFIVALIEVRADLSAALWTIGLEGFAKHLESDSTLHRSTAADLMRSIFTPDMTHISESERLSLIRTPDRLFTPKLRYFAWSVILALLLPLNPITPLLLNGSIDHLIITFMVATLYSVTMAMLVLACFSQPVSWKRSAVLAVAVCSALGSTSFNLYEIGYLLTHYSVAIANGSGFGLDPILWSDLGSDTTLVAHGLAKKAVDGIHGWWFLTSLLMTMIAIKLVRPAVRSGHPRTRSDVLAYVAASTTFLVAMLAGRDPSRSDLYDYLFALFPEGFQNLWLSAEPIHLALPAAAGLIAVAVLRMVLDRNFGSPRVNTYRK